MLDNKRASDTLALERSSHFDITMNKGSAHRLANPLLISVKISSGNIPNSRRPCPLSEGKEVTMGERVNCALGVVIAVLSAANMPGVVAQESNNAVPTHRNILSGADPGGLNACPQKVLGGPGGAIVDPVPCPARARRYAALYEDFDDSSRSDRYVRGSLIRKQPVETRDWPGKQPSALIDKPHLRRFPFPPDLLGNGFESTVQHQNPSNEQKQTKPSKAPIP
jgi:hypothetical protein